MMRSIGFLRTATVAACVATASLAMPPAAYAFHGGGGGFHGGGFGGGGFHGGGWGGRGWGGRGWGGGGWGGPGWGWGGVAFVPGWGGYGWDDGYYDQYPACSLRRVAVRTAWGVRWRTIQYC